MFRTPSKDGPPGPGTRIVVAGGGFGGAYVVRHLENLCRRRPDVEIVLVSRDNYFLMTPLLFEACSGTLDFRHCSVPLRAFLRRDWIMDSRSSSLGSALTTDASARRAAMAFSIRASTSCAETV